MSTTQSMTAAVVALACAAALATPPAVAGSSVYVQVGPPAQRYEYTPAPQHGPVWVPGHWQAQNNGHVWIDGHYLRARQAYQNHRPQWQQPGEHRGHYGGGWGRGDLDRDGIPNRYDRDRDNDGVPNRFDRRPNNPYRY